MAGRARACVPRPSRHHIAAQLLSECRSVEFAVDTQARHTRHSSDQAGARAHGRSGCESEQLGGGDRTRTGDFYVANVALYQLSYTPVRATTLPSGAEPNSDARLVFETTVATEGTACGDYRRPPNSATDTVATEGTACGDSRRLRTETNLRSGERRHARGERNSPATRLGAGAVRRGRGSTTRSRSASASRLRSW